MNPDFFWWSPMWFFPMVMPIIMLAALLVCLYVIFGRGGFRPSWGPERDRESETALEILKKRYARGEITKDEFAQMKKDLS